MSPTATAPYHVPGCPRPDVGGPWLLCPWCGADLPGTRPDPPPPPPPPPPPAYVPVSAAERARRARADAAFRASLLAAPPLPQPYHGRILCITCGADGVRHAAQHRCHACYLYRVRTGRDRPPRLRAVRVAPCRLCGREGHPLRTRGLCSRCYMRTRRPIPVYRALVLVRR